MNNEATFIVQQNYCTYEYIFIQISISLIYDRIKMIYMKFSSKKYKIFHKIKRIFHILNSRTQKDALPKLRYAVRKIQTHFSCGALFFIALKILYVRQLIKLWQSVCKGFTMAVKKSSAYNREETLTARRENSKSQIAAEKFKNEKNKYGHKITRGGPLF